MRKKLLSLKKSTMSISSSPVAVTRPSSTYHALFAHVTLLVIVSGVAALCGVNPALGHNHSSSVLLQSVVSSIFCISAGVLYGIYMILSRLLSLVLSYAEKRSIVTSHYYSDLSYDDQRLLDSDNEEDEDDYDEDDYGHNNNNNFDDNHEHQYIFIHGKRRQVVHHFNRKKMLSRNVVISSMYLGGSGAYLAIPPLCMWDPTVSSSFICCLLILSVIDGGKLISEFKPNIDTGQTITNLKITKYLIHVAVLATICTVIWLDSNNFGEFFYHNNNNGTIIVDHNNHNKHNSNAGGGISIFLRWPLVILAASSPLLMRAGGGGVGPFMHSIPPSQTLETGLPVSILLSILVICWYSPLENPLLTKLTNMATVLPMFILCPLLISGALVFVLRGFKNRSCLYSSLLLTTILVVRQQITRKLKDRLDWVALSLCIFSLTLTLFFLLYKQNVQALALVSKKRKFGDFNVDDEESPTPTPTTNKKMATTDGLNNNNNNNNEATQAQAKAQATQATQAKAKAQAKAQAADEEDEFDYEFGEEAQDSNRESQA